MAVVFARALRDGDVVVTGTNALIPMSACRIAQFCGKTNILPVIGGTGAVEPKTTTIPASGGDQAFVSGKLTLGLSQILSDQVRGFVDVIFLGGLQVDRMGRCNLAVVGGYGNPSLRGPGSIGLSLMARVRRTFLLLLTHDARTFVETVDFISGEGLRSDGRGIELIVTPLGVLGPSSSRDGLELQSIHPGATFDEIQRNTGFRLSSAGVVTTPAPTEAELLALQASPYARQLAELKLENSRKSG
jgi:glutaconate CoA-transferase subunit B